MPRFAIAGCVEHNKDTTNEWGWYRVTTKHIATVVFVLDASNKYEAEGLALAYMRFKYPEEKYRNHEVAVQDVNIVIPPQNQWKTKQDEKEAQSGKVSKGNPSSKETQP